MSSVHQPPHLQGDLPHSEGPRDPPAGGTGDVPGHLQWSGQPHLRHRDPGAAPVCGLVPQQHQGVRLPVRSESAGGQVRGDRGLSPPADRQHQSQWRVRVQAGQRSPRHHQVTRHQG